MTYVTPNQWKALGQYHQFGNRKVFYREAGEGEHLLLVHGFPTSTWDWWKIWPELEQRYHLLAPDQLGFGFSDKNPRMSFTIPTQTDMIESFLDAKGITEFHLLSHDYGVSTVQELIARNNETGKYNIKTCCFLNGGLFQESYKPRIIQRLLLGPLGALVGLLSTKNRLKVTFQDIFGPNTQATQQEIDDFWYLMNHDQGKRIIHKLIKYMHDRKTNADRWTQALLDYQGPMRLIDGPEDPISGAALIEKYQEIIPNPDVVTLPGIGHYPQTEAPELVIEHYLAFRDAHS